MTKKTIILVLIIILLVINTIYWLYVTFKVSKYDERLKIIKGQITYYRARLAKIRQIYE